MAVGGAGGTRTPCLLLAKQALSQMSYSPNFARQRTHGQGRPGHRFSASDFEEPMYSSRVSGRLATAKDKGPAFREARPFAMPLTVG